MTDKKVVDIAHIDRTEQSVPEQSPSNCQKCNGTNFDQGFGLAGGGYGVYEFCTGCGTIVSKTQVED